jgi:hypothetical protein
MECRSQKLGPPDKHVQENDSAGPAISLNARRFPADAAAYWFLPSLSTTNLAWHCGQFASVVVTGS